MVNLAGIRPGNRVGGNAAGLINELIVSSSVIEE